MFHLSGVLKQKSENFYLPCYLKFRQRFFHESLAFYRTPLMLALAYKTGFVVNLGIKQESPPVGLFKLAFAPDFPSDRRCGKVLYVDRRPD